MKRKMQQSRHTLGTYITFELIGFMSKFKRHNTNRLMKVLNVYFINFILVSILLFGLINMDQGKSDHKLEHL